MHSIAFSYTNVHRLAETQHASSVPSAKLDLADLHLTVGADAWEWWELESACIPMDAYGNLQQRWM